MVPRQAPWFRLLRDGAGACGSGRLWSAGWGLRGCGACGDRHVFPEQRGSARRALQAPDPPPKPF